MPKVAVGLHLVQHGKVKGRPRLHPNFLKISPEMRSLVKWFHGSGRAVALCFDTEYETSF